MSNLIHHDHAGNPFRVERVEPRSGIDREDGRPYWLYRFRTEGGTCMAHTYAFDDEGAIAGGRTLSLDYHRRHGISA